MKLIGIGNALMDVVASVETDFAPSIGLHNKSTSHVPYDRIEAIVLALPEPSFTAGGGALNTARIMGMLGMQASFAGAVGNDHFGALVREDLAESGVADRLVTKSSPTGIFLSMSALDGTRTVVVSTGAADELAATDIPDEVFEPGAILYLDGFIAYREAFFRSCLERGKRAGMRIVLDGASYGLVNTRRALFREAAAKYCSLLFLNEDEAAALLDGPFEPPALAALGCDAVVKLAERGAVFVSGDLVVESPVRPQMPFDQTGAGDAFAAGFLAANLHRLPPDRCLRLGNRMAEEAIHVAGCRIDPRRMQVALRSVL